jgi:hypothetical protein
VTAADLRAVGPVAAVGATALPSAGESRFDRVGDVPVGAGTP